MSRAFETEDERLARQLQEQWQLEEESERTDRNFEDEDLAIALRMQQMEDRGLQGSFVFNRGGTSTSNTGNHTTTTTPSNHNDNNRSGPRQRASMEADAEEDPDLRLAKELSLAAAANSRSNGNSSDNATFARIPSSSKNSAARSASSNAGIKDGMTDEELARALTLTLDEEETSAGYSRNTSAVSGKPRSRGSSDTNNVASTTTTSSNHPSHKSKISRTTPAAYNATKHFPEDEFDDYDRKPPASPTTAASNNNNTNNLNTRRNASSNANNNEDELLLQALREEERRVQQLQEDELLARSLMETEGGSACAPGSNNLSVPPPVARSNTGGSTSSAKRSPRERARQSVCPYTEGDADLMLPLPASSPTTKKSERTDHQQKNKAERKTKRLGKFSFFGGGAAANKTRANNSSSAGAGAQRDGDNKNSSTCSSSATGGVARNNGKFQMPFDIPSVFAASLSSQSNDSSGGGNNSNNSRRKPSQSDGSCYPASTGNDHQSTSPSTNYSLQPKPSSDGKNNGLGFDILPKCSGCNQVAFSFINALGKKYHTECFRCVGCNEQIDPNVPFSYTGEGEQKMPMHRDCYAELYGLKCSVCTSPITADDNGRISYVKHPFFDNECMCPSHAVNAVARRCTGCHRFEPSARKFAELGDNDRCVCWSCCRTVIVDSDDAQPLFIRVLDYFKDALDLPIWDGMREIPVLVVGHDTINDRTKDSAHQDSKQIMTRGLCLSEHHMGRRFCLPKLRYDSHSSRFTAVDAEGKGLTFFRIPDASKTNPNTNVTAILCLSGMPRDLTASILAHEATHAWIKMHPDYDAAKPLPPQVEEGCCQLIAHLFLTDGLDPADTTVSQDGGPSDAKLRQYFKFAIETDENEVYGEGFRRAGALFADIGILPLLSHVVMYREFPLL